MCDGDLCRKRWQDIFFTVTHIKHLLPHRGRIRRTLIGQQPLGHCAGGWCLVILIKRAEKRQQNVWEPEEYAWGSTLKLSECDTRRRFQYLQVTSKFSFTVPRSLMSTASVWGSGQNRSSISQDTLPTTTWLAKLFNSVTLTTKTCKRQRDKERQRPFYSWEGVWWGKGWWCFYSMWTNTMKIPDSRSQTSISVQETQYWSILELEHV